MLKALLTLEDSIFPSQCVETFSSAEDTFFNFCSVPSYPGGLKAPSLGPSCTIVASSTGNKTHSKAMSKPIQIQGSIGRTSSEVQLMYQEVIADHRDYCMFQRIVTGMLSRANDEEKLASSHSRAIQQKIDSMPPQSQKVLESIVRTRNQRIESDAPSTCGSPRMHSHSKGSNMMSTMALTDLVKHPFNYHQRDIEFLAAGSHYHRHEQLHHQLMMANLALSNPFPDGVNLWPSPSFEEPEFFLMDDL